MDDMRSMAEEFINELRQLVQPTPKPRKAVKIVALVLGLILAGLVAAVGWEMKKVPEFGRLDANDPE